MTHVALRRWLGVGGRGGVDDKPIVITLCVLAAVSMQFELLKFNLHSAINRVFEGVPRQRQRKRNGQAE